MASLSGRFRQASCQNKYGKWADHDGVLSTQCEIDTSATSSQQHKTLLIIYSQLCKVRQDVKNSGWQRP